MLTDLYGQCVSGVTAYDRRRVVMAVIGMVGPWLGVDTVAVCTMVLTMNFATFAAVRILFSLSTGGGAIKYDT